MRLTRTAFVAIAALAEISMNPLCAGELRAGAAKVSIRPMPKNSPYTAAGEKPYGGVHDELYARALAFDDGASR